MADNPGQGAPPAQTPLEAATKLLGELGDQAFNETGGDTWRSGQPLLNDPTSQHKAQDEAEASPPAKKQGTTPSDEKASTAFEKPLAGKWKTTEEAERGVHELLQYARTAKDERDQFKTKLDLVEGLLNGRRGEPEVPLDPLDELENMVAIPKDPLKRAIRSEIDHAIQEIVKPQMERQKADKAILEKYPEYGEEFDNLLEFLEKNPDIKEEVAYAESQGQYLMARRYAFSLYNAQKQATQQVEGTKRAQSRAEKVAETRPDAAIISPSRHDGRSEPAPESDWPTKDRMDYLKGMARAGHQDLLWRETIGKLLDPTVFPK